MPASHSMHEMMCGHYAPFVIFGKYRGACAKCVADNDPQYARWCLAQEGLPERYPDVCGYWITAGFAPLPRCAAITQAGQSCPNRARDEEMFCGSKDIGV